MKRRLPKGIEYAQDGPHGRPKQEIQHRWISAARRALTRGSGAKANRK